MSNTTKTKTRRGNRHKKMGKERKRVIRREGTTPAFPIHPDKKAEK